MVVRATDSDNQEDCSVELLSGGDMIARALEDEGVEFIFGYPGGAVLHIYDSLFQNCKVAPYSGAP